MIQKMTNNLHPQIHDLLSFATSAHRVASECDKYIESKKRVLYGYEHDGNIVGCIGIEFIEGNTFEIKHIAVSPQSRESGIGEKMIQFVFKQHSIERLQAETDNDAVGFYRKCGFTITSLGEKYPGVERFLCILDSRKGNEMEQSFQLFIENFLDAWKNSSLIDLQNFIHIEYKAREVSKGQIMDFGYEQSLIGWEQGFQFVSENNAKWILEQVSTLPLREDERLVIISATLEVDGKQMDTANLFFDTFKMVNDTEWKLVRSYIEAGVTLQGSTGE